MSIENLSGKEFTQQYFVTVASHDPQKPFLTTSDFSKNGIGSTYVSYVTYGTVEITFRVPECDPIEKAVEAIDSKISGLRADFQRSLESLEEKKQQLLAIGYDIPAAESVVVGE